MTTFPGGTVLLLAAVAAGGGGPASVVDTAGPAPEVGAAGVAPVVDTAGPALEVPFVPQDPLLCGGAAASMVLRFWGERGVRAETFAHLVRPEEGGIRTDELAEALRAMGWTAVRPPPAADDPGAFPARGPPLLALVDGGGGRLHYVVVTGSDGPDLLVHDPQVGPGLRIPRGEFLERWSVADRWSLVVLPAREGANAAAPMPGTGQRAAEVVPEARPVPSLVAASAAFRAERWAEAAREAEEATRAAPADARGWRLLGTSRFLEGDPEGALEAWGRVGEPVLDLVAVDGLRRTRSVDAHRLMGLRPGEVLTPHDLARARRRLALLPSAAYTHLEYRPVGGGLAEARASVAERPLLPSPVPFAVETAARAFSDRTAGASLSSAAGAGERLDVGVRWWAGRPAATVRLSAPGALGLPGVVSVAGSWARERFRVGAGGGGEGSGAEAGGTPPATVERRRAAVSATDWASGALRWSLTASADRWDGGPWRPGAAAAVEVRDRGDRWAVGGGLRGWGGSGRDFGLASVGAAGRLGHARASTSASVSVSLAVAGGAPPLDALPTLGSDGGADLPLRAHPLVEDGALARGGVARSLVHGSAEVVRWADGPLGLRLGLATFLDAARIGEPDGGRATVLDGGFGLRVALPGSPRALRVDRGWSLREAGAAWSVGWSVPLRLPLHP